MRMDMKKTEQKKVPCANCGADTTSSDGADILISELNPPTGGRSLRSPSRKTVFRMRICKECVEKAEVVLTDWVS